MEFIPQQFQAVLPSWPILAIIWAMVQATMGVGFGLAAMQLMIRGLS